MKEGEVRAIISTMNIIDKDGDLTLPGAFGEQRVIISAYGHGSWSGALPVGKGRIHEEGEEAIMDGAFFLDTVNGRETYQTVKDVGELQEWSYALPEIDYEMQTIDGQRVRVLKKITVNEVSPCLMGSGFHTRTLEIKQIANPRKCFSGPLWVDGKMIKSRDMGAELRAIKNRWFRPLDPEGRRQLEEIRQQTMNRQKQLDEMIRYFYTVVGPRCVDPIVRKGAEAACGLAVRELGIPWPVKIIWFVEETAAERQYAHKWGYRDWEFFKSEDPLNGWTRNHADKIRIKAGRGLWETVNTVFHELSHILQKRDIPQPERESRANQFASEFLGRVAV